jgi:hypothetical protein
MTAGIFAKCGAFGGKLLGGDDNNPRGYFENLEIRENITKPLIVELGGDRVGQSNPPSPERLKFTEEQGKRLRDRMNSVMQSHGYTKRPWFYKGAKMCLMWPLYHLAYPKAHWIIVRRPDDQIIDSCLNTNFMRGRNTREGWHQWIDHHKARWWDMQEAGLDIQQVWTPDIVNGDYSAISQAVKLCGLEFNQAEVDKFVEPKFWRRWAA